MNAEQRRAWFTVSIGSICLAAYLIVAPFVGVLPAFAVFGLFGLAGLTPLIGRGEPMDERDHSIARRATLGGAVTSYMAVILADMGIWFYVYGWKGQQQVSVHTLSLVTLMACIVLFFARALAILALYGRSTEAESA